MSLDRRFWRFRPKDAEGLEITSVSGISGALLAPLTAPFAPNQKPQALTTLESFSVSHDLSAVLMPEHSELSSYVYIVGDASEFAQISHQPTPLIPKVKLFRLAPDVTGAVVLGSETVEASLPRGLPVARVLSEVMGILDTQKLYSVYQDTLEPTPSLEPFPPPGDGGDT